MDDEPLVMTRQYRNAAHKSRAIALRRERREAQRAARAARKAKSDLADDVTTVTTGNPGPLGGNFGSEEFKAAWEKYKAGANTAISTAYYGGGTFGGSNAQPYIYQPLPLNTNTYTTLTAGQSISGTLSYVWDDDVQVWKDKNAT